MVFESIDIHDNPAGQARLLGHGFQSVPIVCVGDRCVPGGDLKAVADLVGIAYEERLMLPPVELYAKMVMVIRAAGRYLQQVPFEALEHRSPDRDRSIRALGLHIMQIPLAFMAGYDTGELRLSGMAKPEKPLSELTGADLAVFGSQVLVELGEWWERAGSQDPMDRVIETYWGSHTLHESMERETWHPAQHTRQLMMFLGQLNISPEVPLTASDLAGLPMPSEVWG